MSPPLAFGWHVWTRHRLGLSLCAGYWLLLAIATRTLPIRSLPTNIIALLILMPCGGAFGYLMLVFSVGRDARLERRESGFPGRLWTLPLRTWSLVGWPMLWGTTVLALAWLTLPWGMASPDFDFTLLIWMPALMLAVTLAWLQALVWSPFPLPGLRLLVLGPTISAAAVGPEVLIVGFPLLAAIGYGLLAVQLPLAYGVAVYGVSRARRGDVPQWNWPGGPALLRWTSATTVGRPFVSPARAQLWFEWRRKGHIFPILLAGVCATWFPMMPWIADALDNSARNGVHFVPASLLDEVGSLWLALAAVLVVPILMFSSSGLDMGRLPGRDPTQSLSSFPATRPVSTARLILAKFEMAALSTLAGWGVLLLAVFVWFVLGGKATEMAAAFDASCQRHPPGPFWCGLALFVVGAGVLTWLQMVQGLWLGLLRNRWMIGWALFSMCGLTALLAFGIWLANAPQHRQTAADVLPWLTGGVVVVKSLLAAWSVGALKRRGLLPPIVLWGTLAAWIVLASGLFGVLTWLLPDGRTSLSAIVLGIALLVPLTRLALAPLALDWNRHR